MEPSISLGYLNTAQITEVTTAEQMLQFIDMMLEHEQRDSIDIYFLFILGLKFILKFAILVSYKIGTTLDCFAVSKYLKFTQ